MSKKSFIVILVLSLVVTYGAAYVDFVLNITTGAVGLPFGFSSFNFLGAETNQKMLILDIAFWYFIIWLVWFGIKKLTNK